MSELEWMGDELSRYRYKPTWRLELHGAGDTAVLVVRYNAPDSRNPGGLIRPEGRRALKPTTDPRVFADDVLAQLDDIERHETREWLRYNGELVFDPHADPDRWHCVCGGVGPVKHEGSWTCPGCRTKAEATT